MPNYTSEFRNILAFYRVLYSTYISQECTKTRLTNHNLRRKAPSIFRPRQRIPKVSFLVLTRSCPSGEVFRNNVRISRIQFILRANVTTCRTKSALAISSWFLVYIDLSPCTYYVQNTIYVICKMNRKQQTKRAQTSPTNTIISIVSAQYLNY